MKWTTLLILSCFCCSTYGQDYLVTNKGDTLRGKIKIMSYDRLDRVQVNDQKKKTVFTAMQVKEVFFDGAAYHPKQAENSIRFMKLVKPGYLSLYSARDESQNYSKRYLIKRDGAMIEVPNLSFKKSMIDFLGDCETVKEKLGGKDYGKKDLDQIIDDYNAFIESNTTANQEARAFRQKAATKIDPLQKLKKTVQDQNEFPSKKDALDLIDDIIAKIKGGQAIPNYLVEGLQKYLADIEATKEDLEKALDFLNE